MWKESNEPIPLCHSKMRLRLEKKNTAKAQRQRGVHKLSQIRPKLIKAWPNIQAQIQPIGLKLRPTSSPSTKHIHIFCYICQAKPSLEEQPKDQAWIQPMGHKTEPKSSLIREQIGAPNSYPNPSHCSIMMMYS